MCGASRLLLWGFIVGAGVTTVTGTDLLGWIAAAATVGVLAGAQRIRGTRSMCPRRGISDRRTPIRDLEASSEGASR